MDIRFRKRLRQKIVVTSTGCWLLTTSLHKNGYAAIGYRGKAWLAHRAVYTEYKGEIPEGMQVMHSCDVRNCVRPTHLSVGTQIDNEKEKFERGRASLGEQHYASVLTEELVRKLRQEYTPGDSWMALEKKYGINRGVIRPAVLGRTWRHVK